MFVLMPEREGNGLMVMIQKVAGSDPSWATQGLENSLSTQQYFELEIRQEKERNGLRLSYSLPKIQWTSNPHCPYGHSAVRNLYLLIPDINSHEE